MNVEDNRMQSSEDVLEVSKRRVAFAVVELTFVLFALYLLVAVLAARWRKHFCIPYRQKQLAKTRRFLDGFFVAYIVLGLAKFSLTLTGLLIESPGHVYLCVTFGRAFQFLHATGYAILYLFLWMRQSTLYRNPVLRKLATPALCRASWVLLAVIILVSTLGIVSLQVTTNEGQYFIDNRTEQCKYNTEANPNSVVVYAGYAMVILTQVCILSLFIHILLKHEGSRPSPSFHLATWGARKRCLRGVIRNCCLAAGVSSLTDLAVILCYGLGVRRYFLTLELYVLWDCDYMINLACTLFCFRNWRHLLWPWGAKHPPTRTPGTTMHVRALSTVCRPQQSYDAVEGSTDTC